MFVRVLMVAGVALLPVVAVAQNSSTQSGTMPAMPNLGTPQAAANMGQEPPNAKVRPTGPAVGQPNTVPTPVLNEQNTKLPK